MTDEPRDPPPENGPEDSRVRKPGQAEDELRSLVEEIVTDRKSHTLGETRSEARDIIHDTPPDPDADEPKDPDHDPLAGLRGIVPRSESELRALGREIVGEVLQDVEAGRRAAAEPVQIVAIPQMLVPHIHFTKKQWTWIVAMLVVLIGGPVTWIKWPRTVEIPDGAVGLWATVSPRYADRAFRIGKTTLTIHVSPQDSTFHPIVRVETTEDQVGGATEYTVFYEHYGDVYEFTFLYHEDPDTTIHFVNQREMTWRKQSL